MDAGCRRPPLGRKSLMKRVKCAGGLRKEWLWRLCRLEIRDQAVLFPIAITGRVEAAAAAGFRGLVSVAITLGTARCGFCERTFRCRRQRGLFAGLALGFGCRRALRLRLGWHRL